MRSRDPVARLPRRSVCWPLVSGGDDVEWLMFFAGCMVGAVVMLVVLLLVGVFGGKDGDSHE